MNNELNDTLHSVGEDFFSAVCDSAATVARSITDAFGCGGDDHELNVVTAISDLGHNAKRIADSITDGGASPGPDGLGGHVGCLTESVMSVATGLSKIADAINDLADAVREGQ